MDSYRPGTPARVYGGRIMTTTIFFAVLFAAALHASWNALVKGGGDKVVAMNAVVVGQGAAGLIALAFAPLPGWEALHLMTISVVLHIGYQLFLLQGYKLGDLSQVYPIARGVAPLIVTVTLVGFLDESLSRIELTAVGLIILGVMSMSLARQSDGLRNARAAVFAGGTGCFIAAYSLVDGYGGRMSDSAVGFYAIVAIANGVLFPVLTRAGMGTRLGATMRAWRTILIGGGASFIAYAIVVYAFTQSSIALVTALRETSIIFAMLIGVLALGERMSIVKALSAMTALGGAVLLRLSKGS